MVRKGTSKAEVQVAGHTQACILAHQPYTPTVDGCLRFVTSLLCECAEGVVREGHFKWWDTHKVADTAYPEEKLVPGFK